MPAVQCCTAGTGTGSLPRATDWQMVVKAGACPVSSDPQPGEDEDGEGCSEGGGRN